MRATDDMIVIPRWAADQITTGTPRFCNVCLGRSPSWDGHDKNPPCRGAAIEAVRTAMHPVHNKPATARYEPSAEDAE